MLDHLPAMLSDLDERGVDFHGREGAWKYTIKANVEKRYADGTTQAVFGPFPTITAAALDAAKQTRRPA